MLPSWIAAVIRARLVSQGAPRAGVVVDGVVGAVAEDPEVEALVVVVPAPVPPADVVVVLG
jgi:hypothetical protein